MSSDPARHIAGRQPNSQNWSKILNYRQTNALPEKTSRGTQDGTMQHHSGTSIALQRRLLRNFGVASNRMHKQMCNKAAFVNLCCMSGEMQIKQPEFSPSTRDKSGMAHCQSCDFSATRGVASDRVPLLSLLFSEGCGTRRRPQ